VFDVVFINFLFLSGVYAPVKNVCNCSPYRSDRRCVYPRCQGTGSIFPLVPTGKISTLEPLTARIFAARQDAPAAGNRICPT
jgi:hypothetical protein